MAPQLSVADNITTQPKQGRWAMPMSSLSIILCLCSEQGTLTEGEGSVDIVPASLDRLLLIMPTFFTFVQNKLPYWGGQLY